MNRRRERLATYLVLAFFSVVTLYPILGVASVALTAKDSVTLGLDLPWPPDFSSFASVWSSGNFSTYLRSSALVAVTVTVVASALSIAAGYAFGTMRFRGSNALFYFLLLGLVVPAEATIIPLYYDLLYVGLTDTYWSVILPNVGISVAFGTFWMRAFFRSTPSSLREAARLDGVTSLGLLWRILVPIARPAILTMVLLVFMWTWNDFLLPLVMLQSPDIATAPIGITLFIQQYSVQQRELAAASMIVALPVVLVYVALQRHFIRGMMAGALKF